MKKFMEKPDSFVSIEKYFENLPDRARELKLRHYKTSEYFPSKLIPANSADFIENFLFDWNFNYESVDPNQKIHTKISKRRSVVEVYDILRYYYPNYYLIKNYLADLFEVVRRGQNGEIHRIINSEYGRTQLACHKIVFFYYCSTICRATIYSCNPALIQNDSKNFKPNFPVFPYRAVYGNYETVDDFLMQIKKEEVQKYILGDKYLKTI